MIFNSKVQAVLQYLKDNNVNFVIAGGYPRDIYFGRIPKDLDVFCYGECYANLPLDSNIFVREEFDLWLDEVPNEYDMSDFSAIRLRDIRDVNLNLVWRHDCESQQDVLDKFDFNINQFILVATENTNLRSVHARFLGEDFGVLKQHNDCTQERKDKMEQIALMELHWAKED